MSTYQVKRLDSDSHVTVVTNCDSILEARDKFARQKGYNDWGDMVVSYKRARNEFNKPPFYFKK